MGRDVYRGATRRQPNTAALCCWPCWPALFSIININMVKANLDIMACC